MATAGRSKRATVRRPAGEAEPGRAAEPVTLTRRHGAIRTLTGKVLSIVQRTGKLDVEARVEIGGILAEVQGQLDHGEWIRWLDEMVPFTERSARSYMHLQRWATEHPGLCRKLAPLGPSKLYLLMALDEQALAALLKRSQHPIGDSGKTTTLELMTVRELMTVIAELTGALSQEDASDQLIGQYRRRLRGLLSATAALAEHAALIPREPMEELYVVLLEAAEQLAELFELGLRPLGHQIGKRFPICAPGLVAPKGTWPSIGGAPAL